jgi:hypothetical protein
MFPLLGEHDALLAVQETTAVLIVIPSVSCEPPPIGLSCFHLERPFHRHRGHRLGAARRSRQHPQGGASLEQREPDLAIGGASTPLYEILRGTSKLDLPLPGPPSLINNIVIPPAIDSGAISTPDPYFYRVRAVECSTPGPY